MRTSARTSEEEVEPMRLFAVVFYGQPLVKNAPTKKSTLYGVELLMHEDMASIKTSSRLVTSLQ